MTLHDGSLNENGNRHIACGTWGSVANNWKVQVSKHRFESFDDGDMF